MPPPCEGSIQNLILQLVDEDVVEFDGDEADDANNTPEWDEYFLGSPFGSQG